MSEQAPSKEWGTPEQVRFVLGFVREVKRSGAEMCPLHVDFLITILERLAQPPRDEQATEKQP